MMFEVYGRADTTLMAACERWVGAGERRAWAQNGFLCHATNAVIEVGGLRRATHPTAAAVGGV